MPRELVVEAVASEAVEAGDAAASVGSEAPVVDAAAEAEELIPQRCYDRFPHIAHDVPALGTRTAFRCHGALTAADLDRLLKPFGDDMSRGPN